MQGRRSTQATGLLELSALDAADEIGAQDRLAGKIARVERALEARWWQSRASDRFDALFEVESQAANVQSFRFWLCVLMAAQLLGLLRDISFGIEQMGLVLRCVVMLPVEGAIVFALGRNPTRRATEWMTSLAVMSALLVQISLSVFAPVQLADRYLMGASFVFSIAHLVMPFTYRQVILHAGIVAVALNGMFWLNSAHRPASLMDRLDIMLPGIVLVAACGALMARHNRRRVFLMDLRSTLQSQALTEANEKLGQLLRQDTLTGVYNRRYFDETMQRLWQQAGTEATPLGLILLDVDRFKSFNDCNGHQAGDSCLKDVATRLSSTLQTATSWSPATAGKSSQSCFRASPRLRRTP